jgi:hypothetical protein
MDIKCLGGGYSSGRLWGHGGDVSGRGPQPEGPPPGSAGDLDQHLTLSPMRRRNDQVCVGIIGIKMRTEGLKLTRNFK